MKFKFHDAFSDSETESDWDTQIDLVTTTTRKQNLLLMAENGVILSFSSESISWSHRYLEPDFSREEKTGEFGPYVYHDDPDADFQKNTYWGGHAVTLAEEVTPISVSEFKKFHKSKAPSGITKWKIDRFHARMHDREISCEEFLNTPHTASQFDTFTRTDVGFGLEMVEQVFKAIPENFGERGGPQEFEFAIPKACEEMIRAVGAESVLSKTQFSKIVIDNMAREANAKLSIFIDELAAKNKAELVSRARIAI